MRTKKFLFTLGIVFILFIAFSMTTSAVDYSVIKTFYNDYQLDFEYLVFKDAENKVYIPFKPYAEIEGYTVYETENYITCKKDNEIIKISKSSFNVYVNNKLVMKKTKELTYSGKNKDISFFYMTKDFAEKIFDMVVLTDEYVKQIQLYSGNDDLKLSPAKEELIKEMETIKDKIRSFEEVKELPTNGLYNTKIIWESNNQNLVSNDGKINNEKVNSLTQDITVDLKATIMINDKSIEEHFSLGFFDKYQLNSRNYNWYYSQQDTGLYSDVNCGPSVAAMALKWYDKNISKTVEQVREEIETTTGMTVYELKNYLMKNNLKINDFFLKNKERLFNELNKGNIIIAIVSMEKYYESPIYKDLYHFIVINGFKFDINNNLYFYVYDPNYYGLNSVNEEKLLDSITICNNPSVIVQGLEK